MLLSKDIIINTLKWVNGRRITILSGWTAFIIFLVLYGLHDYTMFHVAVELFGILISLSIAIVAYNTHNISENWKNTCLGIVYSFVGFFYLMHVVYYNNPFAEKSISNDLSMHFSLAAKYFESISLLLLFLLFSRLPDLKLKPFRVYAIYSLISVPLTTVIILGIYLPNMLTDLSKPTSYKLINETIVTIIFIMVLISLLIKRKTSNYSANGMLITAIALKILSQIFIIIYDNPYDFFSILAHISRFVSYYFMYKTIVQISLKNPFENLFSKFSRTNEILEARNQELLEINDKLKHEIAKRSLIEEALNDSDQQYRMLVEMLPDGVLVIKSQKVVFANNTAADIFGIENPDSLKGRQWRDFVRFDAEAEIDLGEKLVKLKNEGQAIPLMELSGTRLDGKLFFIEITSTPIIYNNSTMTLAVFRDIRERKKIEEMQKNIEQNVKLLREAAELDKQKSEFIANISHELRTPLNVLLGALQLFDMYMSDKAGLEQHFGKMDKHVRTMKQNCKRLLRLVNNLIDITKIDVGFMEMNMQNIDIVSLIENITLSVEPYTGIKNIKLSFDSDPEEKYISCDPDKIERIMLNLLSNAIKFTKNGGSISVNIFDCGYYVKVCVKDTGIGIPKNKQQIVFERFRQVNESLARNNEGSGIGLSLVKSYVEMHKGRIDVESEPGIGSVFSVILPVSNPDVEDNLDTESNPLRNRYDFSEFVEKISIEFSDIFQ